MCLVLHEFDDGFLMRRHLKRFSSSFTRRSLARPCVHFAIIDRTKFSWKFWRMRLFTDNADQRIPHKTSPNAIQISEACTRSPTWSALNQDIYSYGPSQNLFKTNDNNISLRWKNTTKQFHDDCPFGNVYASGMMCTAQKENGNAIVYFIDEMFSLITIFCGKRSSAA